MSNTLNEFSNDLASAVEKGGASTILVDARKRYPASGIAFAEDLILTADHVVTREEEIKVILPEGKSLNATQVKSLSEMPPLPVMRATLLGVLQAPASKLVRTLAEPARGLAAVVKARSESAQASA